ncbi:MAG: lysoplasmalogenase [Chitinophagales bacterium]|nr:lysoplasmalogenase [Chitinophagales bacterium]
MNNSVSPKHFIFFFLIAAMHLAAIVAGSGAEMVVTFTKPFLLIALLIVFSRLTRNRKNIQIKFVFAALIFSWFGDVTLLFQEMNPNYFLIGLVCFLLAHLAYVISFKLRTKSGISNSLPYKEEPAGILRKHPWLIFLFLGYAAIILSITYHGLGDMLVPVIVYMCVILMMGLTALNRFGKVSSISFKEVFAGAIFFMLSDSLLAINKFSQPIPSASFLIMFTYILAQYLIVKGMLDEGQWKEIITKTGVPEIIKGEILEEGDPEITSAEKKP